MTHVSTLYRSAMHLWWWQKKIDENIKTEIFFFTQHRKKLCSIYSRQYIYCSQAHNRVFLGVLQGFNFEFVPALMLLSNSIFNFHLRVGHKVSTIISRMTQRYVFHLFRDMPSKKDFNPLLWREIPFVQCRHNTQAHPGTVWEPQMQGVGPHGNEIWCYE